MPKRATSWSEVVEQKQINSWRENLLVGKSSLFTLLSCSVCLLLFHRIKKGTLKPFYLSALTRLAPWPTRVFPIFTFCPLWPLIHEASLLTSVMSGARPASLGADQGQGPNCTFRHELFSYSSKFSSLHTDSEVKYQPHWPGSSGNLYSLDYLTRKPLH